MAGRRAGARAAARTAAIVGLIAGMTGCTLSKPLTEVTLFAQQDSPAKDPPAGAGDPGPAGPSGPADAIDPACMTSDKYDACIFYKNPVAQNKAPLTPRATVTSDLSRIQTFGVKLPKLDGSGFLQNATYRIAAPGLARTPRNAQGNWKYPFSNCTAPNNCTADPNHNIGQLMAYYWLTKQEEQMEATGGFYAKGRNITVNTFSPNLNNAYWDPTARQIVLGETEGREFALAAEIYDHEAGHANFTYATNNTLGASTQTHRACGRGLCCSTRDGCVFGIHEGVGDFSAAIVFPDSLPMAESIENSVAGFDACGIPRDVSRNTALTAAQAYNACTQALGEVHATGTLYASIWWEVRKKAGADAKELEKLFTEHLKTLTSTDTFVTAVDKIRATANSLFGGKFAADFAAELARRGL